MCDSQARRNSSRDQSYRNTCFGFRGGQSGGKGSSMRAAAPFKRVSSVEVASEWVTAASDGEVGGISYRVQGLGPWTQDHHKIYPREKIQR